MHYGPTYNSRDLRAAGNFVVQGVNPLEDGNLVLLQLQRDAQAVVAHVMRHYAVPILQSVPEDGERHDEMLELVRAFEYFEAIDPSLVAPNSLLREFIGGGCPGSCSPGRRGGSAASRCP